MQATQWLGLLLMLLVFGGLLAAFLRGGAKIKPDRDRRHEDWPPPTQNTD
jgi:hypothetical protein